eukprot:TRINITY_DN21589_c0_g1_i1.p1 TRINITY_DN21589_c0_g1~~TRINITY_DN21589_c0_g1_i1.p1  ORF type:complete len:446 (+),score=39.53 TRINITY_DN21589_c0_g1_i1:31-1368(+)
MRFHWWVLAAVVGCVVALTLTAFILLAADTRGEAVGPLSAEIRTGIELLLQLENTLVSRQATLKELENQVAALRKEREESWLERERHANVHVAGNNSEPTSPGNPGPNSTMYLFYRPRCCSGINNQLEELWYAMHLARLLGRGLVLPMIAESVTWYHIEMDRLFPFDLFFDSTRVQKLMPTITTQQFKERCHSTFQLDAFPSAKNRIVQKKYEMYLGITYEGVPRVVIPDWRALQREKLPACLGVHWPRELLHGSLDQHRWRPGDPPLGCLIERNEKFRLVRAHTVPAQHILRAANSFVQPLGKYIAVHIRVGDFLKWCNGKRDPIKCPTDQEHSAKVRAVAKEHKIYTVFVAAAVDAMPRVIKFLRDSNPEINFVSFRPDTEPFKSHPDVVGVTEQQICANATIFVGNAWSTWTRSVHEMRFLQGKSCTSDLLWGIGSPWCPAP